MQNKGGGQGNYRAKKVDPRSASRYALKQDVLPEDGAYGDKFAKMSEKTPKKRRGRGVAASARRL